MITPQVCKLRHVTTRSTLTHIAGLAIVIAFGLSDSANPHQYPISLSEAERKAEWLVERVPSMEIRLLFLPQQAFNKLRSDNGAEPDELARVVAFTLPNQHPCVIVMRAGAVITAVPREGSAEWGDEEAADTLAHEILHCMRGDWHTDWDTIEQASGR